MEILPQQESAPDKLALGVEGGFSGIDHELEKSFSLAVFDKAAGKVVGQIPYPFTVEWDNDIPGIISMACEAVKVHAGAAAQDASGVWEDKDEVRPSKYADNLVQVPVGDQKISPDPATWKCGIHGATDNLWLNLSDGFIGGGRKFWDGSGGSGGALEHYQTEKAKGNEFPLVVKLGTITPHGAGRRRC